MAAAAESAPMISMEEVRKHNSKTDCWVVLYGKAWDLSKFAKAHPGGSKIIFELAGMDGTAQFDPIHPKDIMDKLLKPTLMMGVVDPATIDPAKDVKQIIKKAPPPKKKAVAKKRRSDRGGGGLGQATNGCNAQHLRFRIRRS